MIDTAQPDEAAQPPLPRRDSAAGSGERRAGQRIAKAMARAGLCSRRDAETWIAAGRVAVNGVTLTSPAFNVGPGDDVRVDGAPLAAPERTRLFLYNKPRGRVTTARDPEGRPTIFEALPQELPRVVAVGRLDINSEGLLLLTNDGGLARVLELPATGWLRRYRVRAHGEIAEGALEALAEGLVVDGIAYAGIEARLDRVQGANVWLTMALREGKNREIKKVLEHLGLAVNRLIRVSFGPFQLGDLAEGLVEEVRTRVLREQLGARLAKEAGADFDAPPARRAEPPAGESKRPARPPRGGPRSRPPEQERREARPGARGGPRSRPPERERREARPADPRSHSNAPPRRKHVSKLRDERRQDEAGPRKRIARGAAVDRKGREIAVERLLPTPAEARRRALLAARAEARRKPPRDKSSREKSSRDKSFRDKSFRDKTPRDKSSREKSFRDRPARGKGPPRPPRRG
jgi:23S rRNA pseudouridine2605 synthase